MPAILCVRRRKEVMFVTPSEEKDWEKLKDAHYGKPFRVVFLGGIVDFSPRGLKSLASSPKCMTYDDYLAAQVRSIGKQRIAMRDCYFHQKKIEAEGTVLVANKNMALVSRLKLKAEGSPNKIESHVWLYRNSIRDEKDFDFFGHLAEGDRIRFSARAYRYYRKDGTIDFGLKNPSGIRKLNRRTVH